MFLKPCLTLRTIQRTQRRVEDQIFMKCFLVFEAQIGNQYRVIRGAFQEKQFKLSKRNPLYELKIYFSDS